MKAGFFFSILLSICTPFLQAQNVGIGTNTPQYKLDVVGDISASNNCYLGGYIGVGTLFPVYKIQVENGSVALHSSADFKYWIMSYNSAGNYFNISEDGTARLTILNGGNVGIGTNTPSAKLDVAGSAEINGTLVVNGAGNISGALSVNNNRGVVYNLSGSTNIKYYTRTVAFTVVNLGAHVLSAEASIGFISGFSSTPQVYVGNIVSNGGTTGPLYQLQLILYNVTPTGCKCRILNTSNATINQTITWNIMAFGN